jgi:hypothetical protein
MVSLWRSRFYPIRIGGVLCRCCGVPGERTSVMFVAGSGEHHAGLGLQVVGIIDLKLWIGASPTLLGYG